MTRTLSTCLMVAGMTALLLRPVADRWLRPSHRGSAHRGSAQRVQRTVHRAAFDYAAMLDAITRQVRSGSSLTSALIDAVDQSSPLGQVGRRLAAGRSLADVLADVAPTDADLALTVQALSASAHLGGPIAATLDEAAAVLRERVAARAERRAHGSQARLSARVLTIVPLAFAVWSLVASQRTRDVYLSNGAGGICAVCGLVLNIAGWKWMRRIIGPA
jgi:Flp pilus assembly protein TadB